MTKFKHDVVNGSVTMLGDRLHRRLQLVAKIGRYTDRVPIQFGIAIAESISFRFNEVCPCVDRPQAIYQEFVSFHLAEFDPRIESRRVPINGIEWLFRIVPVEGLEIRYENSLAKVLTFGQAKLQLCDPLLITQVWPLVTIDADDASLRCSSIAWLYSRDLATFPAESPCFSGCIRQLCFDIEKSLRIEVRNDHRS